MYQRTTYNCSLEVAKCAGYNQRNRPMPTSQKREQEIERELAIVVRELGSSRWHRRSYLILKVDRAGRCICAVGSIVR